MNKQDFKDLTGEDPEDMFGGDWQNEIDELELTPEDIKTNQRHTEECDSIVYPMGKCSCKDTTPQEKMLNYWRQQGEI